ncbi:uncharacterized protein LOC118768321 isoform X2 [Octopus sinensis]|uniref:Uncharacterized protein LOC118768321 isoform X2 n=1 Tax=Octopus sinensis TaxID=2607531 RepID=A0A7E6FSC5_9MOLL|nr:uncharacterized protein LOC118768321 isoform X2 [Octopus sinensis]
MNSTSHIPDRQIVLSTGENPDVIRPNNNGWSIDVMKIPTASVEIKLGYILTKGAILRLPKHDNVYQYEVTTLTSNMTKLDTKTRLANSSVSIPSGTEARSILIKFKPSSYKNMKITLSLKGCLMKGLSYCKHMCQV